MKKLILILTLALISSSAFSMEYAIDRLAEPAIAKKLEGKVLGLLTHAAARSKKNEHLIDILFHSFTLKRIFAPEHGLRTAADDYVGDGVDEATGLPVISLYKKGSKGPTPKELAGLDTIVIDLQDVGVRYYTYFATIAEVMKVAAQEKVEVIILDRPNLLGGIIVEGKTLDPSLAGGFTSYHTIPTRHGMTLGELALLLNAEKKMNVDLTVIPTTGWKRENLLTNTERAWIPPSPALVELPQVGLYAMWGTLESFNLAVGRGVDNSLAFKVLGAPWMRPEEAKTLSHDLNALGFAHISFAPFSWDVTRAEYHGKRANGVKMTWDGGEVRTDEFTYKVTLVLLDLFPTRIGIKSMSPASYGSLSMVNAMKDGVPWNQFGALIDAEIEAFKIRRKPYLIY